MWLLHYFNELDNALESTCIRQIKYFTNLLLKLKVKGEILVVHG